MLRQNNAVHLASTGLIGNHENTSKDAEKLEEDYELRLKCVKVMIDLGCVPITMKLRKSCFLDCIQIVSLTYLS